MRPRRLLTLTTDFGHRGSFVGQLKGAALAVDPGLRIVDLCHEVPAHDVAAGAYVLETGYGVFPAGTVHLAVVDPGVGTERRAVAVSTRRYTFVAPDNGLLTRVLEHDPPVAIHSIDDRALFRSSVSATFEGRDRFAPVAARLAGGLDPAEVGAALDDLTRLERIRPTISPAVPCEVPVIFVDAFGNVVIDVTAETASAALGAPIEETTPLRLVTPAATVTAIRRTYSAGGAGPFLLVNSAGYLEVAVAGGRADRLLGVSAGSSVEMTLGG